MSNGIWGLVGIAVFAVTPHIAAPETAESWKGCTTREIRVCSGGEVNMRLMTLRPESADTVFDNYRSSGDCWTIPAESEILLARRDDPREIPPEPPHVMVQAVAIPDPVTGRMGFSEGVQSELGWTAWPGGVVIHEVEWTAETNACDGFSGFSTAVRANDYEGDEEAAPPPDLPEYQLAASMSLGCYEEHVTNGLVDAFNRGDTEEIGILFQYAFERSLCVFFDMEDRFHILEESGPYARVRLVGKNRTYWTPRALLRPH